MSIVFEDMGDAYEHVAQLENRIADLENDLNGRECWRCGYRVSGRDWEAIRKFGPPGGVRCVGCGGTVGDWHRHRVRELTEELEKRGSETCELRQRVGTTVPLKYLRHLPECGRGCSIADSLANCGWPETERKWRDCTCGLAEIVLSVRPEMHCWRCGRLHHPDKSCEGK